MTQKFNFNVIEDNKGGWTSQHYEDLIYMHWIGNFSNIKLRHCWVLLLIFPIEYMRLRVWNGARGEAISLSSLSQEHHREGARGQVINFCLLHCLIQGSVSKHERGGLKNTITHNARKFRSKLVLIKSAKVKRTRACMNIYPRCCFCHKNVCARRRR